MLNSITMPLSQANLGIFAISTYDTDYVLVKQEVLPQALSALTEAGHTIHTRSIPACCQSSRDKPVGEKFELSTTNIGSITVKV